MINKETSWECKNGNKKLKITFMDNKIIHEVTKFNGNKVMYNITRIFQIR